MFHRWPVPGGKVHSEFSDFLVYRPPTDHTPVRTLHGGLDISYADNRPHLVIACAPGKVVTSTTETTYNPGNIVTAGVALYQGKPITLYICYGHMSPVAVRAWPVGRVIMPGVPLGFYGSSEEIKAGAVLNKTSPDMRAHLHLEIRMVSGGALGETKRAFHFDPYLFLSVGRLQLGKVQGRRYPLTEF